MLTRTGPGKLSAQLRMGCAWRLRQGYAGIVTIDGNGKDGGEAVADMAAKLEAGFDYVQGSRYLPDPRAQPFRDVFMRDELLFHLTARAGRIGMKAGHVPVQRRYSANAATPTRITGFGGRFDVLKQTFGAAFGAYHPKGSGGPARSGATGRPPAGRGAGDARVKRNPRRVQIGGKIATATMPAPCRAPLRRQIIRP
ncbi:hypothetical protein [Albimonas donghaensis]|uniref:hypothetical protein n=1 Tax=Albimonas donghaensis TaxID=356660 RepID=UPI0015A05326|nr:hypothetical protein [Albimonas donghaensis]